MTNAGKSWPDASDEEIQAATNEIQKYPDAERRAILAEARRRRQTVADALEKEEAETRKREAKEAALRKAKSVKTAEILAIVTAVMVIAGLVYLTWGVLGETLPIWAKVLGSIIALLISGVAGLFIRYVLDPTVSRAPAFSNPCPRCGAELKYQKEVPAGWYTQTVGTGGHGTRTAQYVSEYKCRNRKCDYVGPKVAR